MIWWALKFTDSQSGFAAWTDDRNQLLGVFYEDGTPAKKGAEYETADVNAKPPVWAAQVEEPPAPVFEAPPRTDTSAGFIMRFTPDEAKKIHDSADPLLVQWLMALGTTSEVNLEDPIVRQGVGMLAALGYIDPTRVVEILS